MKVILKTIVLSLVLGAAILASAVLVAAQEARTFELGQTVEIFCNCFGDNAWVKGKIEDINDSGYVVRYGSGTYQTKAVKFGSDRIRDPNQTPAPIKPGNLSNDRRIEANGNTNVQTPVEQREENGYKIGDTVEMSCGNCENARNGWVRVKIVSIDYSRTDEGEYVLDAGTKNYRGEPTLYKIFVHQADRELRALDEERNGQIRRQFLEEAQPYLRTFDVFDPNGSYQKSGIIPSGEETNYKADFQAVAALCQRYGKVTNPPNKSSSLPLSSRPADLCEMAKQGDAMIADAKAGGIARDLASAQKMALDDLENAFDTPNGMREETQRIVFDRSAWEREERAKLARYHPGATAEMLKKYFAEIFAKADGVKTRIESEAPNKSWDAPVLHNAALEGMVRNYYAKYRPGVTIVKIGMYQNDYKLFKNSLGIPTTQVISGVALVKIAGRPLCQSQIFELNKEYMGGGRWSAVKPLYIGREGTFVKCQ